MSSELLNDPVELIKTVVLNNYAALASVILQHYRRCQRFRKLCLQFADVSVFNLRHPLALTRAAQQAPDQLFGLAHRQSSLYNRCGGGLLLLSWQREHGPRMSHFNTTQFQMFSNDWDKIEQSQ